MLKKISFAVIIISLVLSISACEKISEPISQSMETQLALLPEQATIIGYANIKKIHNSEFLNMFLDSTRHSPFHEKEYQEFVENTGLDLQRDVNEVYIAANPGLTNNEKNGLAVILGKFQSERIIDYIKSKTDIREGSINTYNYEDYKIYQVSDDDTVNFTFIDAKTLLIGNEANIQLWIDKSLGKSKKSGNDLLKKVNDLKFKDTAWFTMNTSYLTKILKDKDIKKLKSIENLKKFSVSMNLVDTFKLFGQSEFESDEQAELFRDAIKGLIAAGKLSASDDRNIVDLLNSITVNQKNSQVLVNIEFSKQEMEKILNMKNTMASQIITAI